MWERVSCKWKLRAEFSKDKYSLSFEEMMRNRAHGILLLEFSNNKALILSAFHLNNNHVSTIDSIDN